MPALRLLPSRHSRLSSSDKEFLAPALAILETPPSPVSTALLLLICGLVVATGAWATLGHINIEASAPGKLEPVGNVRTVQVLEAGRVHGISAVDGNRVRAGDVLFTLDPAVLLIQRERTARDVFSSRAEILRREAAIRNVQAVVSAPVDWPDDIPQDIQQREEDVLQADLARLHATETELRARIEQQAADQAKLDYTITVENQLLTVLRQPVQMQEQLQQQGIGARVNLVQAQAAMERQNSVVVQAVAQRRQLAASMALARDQLQTASESFIATQSQRLNAARRALDRAKVQASLAQISLDHATIRAPVSGIVQASNLTTIGQVFQAGQEAMRIVPEDTPLQVVAEVRNQDIGFIEIGQTVAIKVNAYPFTQYGMLRGRVIQVANDAISSGDSQYSDASPGQAPRTPGDASRQQVLNLVFPVTIELSGTQLSANGRIVPVTAGMQVSAEIDTGSRRIIEYVLAPVVEAMSSAGKER